MRLAAAASIAAVIAVGLARGAAAEPAPLVLTADGTTAELTHARAFVHDGRFLIMLSPSEHGCEQTFEASIEEGDVHLRFKGKKPSGPFSAARNGADAGELAPKGTGSFVVAGGKVVGHVEVTWPSGATLRGDVDAVVCEHPGAPAAAAPAAATAGLGAAGKTRLASLKNGAFVHVVLGRDLLFQAWDAAAAKLTPEQREEQGIYSLRVPLTTCYAHGVHVRASADGDGEAPWQPDEWKSLPTASDREPSCCVTIEDQFADPDLFVQANPQGRQPDGVDTVALAGSHIVFVVSRGPDDAPSVFAATGAELMQASLTCGSLARKATLADLQAVLGDAFTIVPGFVLPTPYTKLYRALPFTTRAATADDWKR